MAKRDTDAGWAAVEPWAKHWTAINERFKGSAARVARLFEHMGVERGSLSWQTELRAECAEWRRLVDDFAALPAPQPAEGVRVRTVRVLGLVAHAADDVDAWLAGAGSDRLAAAFTKIGEAISLQQETRRRLRRVEHVAKHRTAG